MESCSQGVTITFPGTELMGVKCGVKRDRERWELANACHSSSGIARRSDCAVIQGHNVFLAHTSYERLACSPGRQGYFWGFVSILGISGCYIKGDWIFGGDRCIGNGAGGG